MRSLNVRPLVTLVVIIGLISSCKGQATPETRCDSLNGAIDCESATTHLECDLASLKCRCEDHLISYFDYFDKKCYRNDGADCEDDPAKMHCTPNSECKNSLCECLKGFESTAGLKCSLPFNSPCLEADDCDRDIFLECSPPSSRCQCQSTATYDPVLKKCFANIGKSCQTNLLAPCPTHATCQDPSQTCQCEPGFSSNSKNQCKGDNGAECVFDTDCDELKFLVCGSSRKCECDQGSVYHDGDKVCKIMAAQLCEEAEFTGQPCVDNAECEEVTSGGGAGHDYCMCNDGLTLSAGHQCYRQFGQTCNDVTRPCNKEKFHGCDRTCSCKDPLNTWPDPTNHYCYLLAGRACSVDPSSDLQACAPHSHCQLTSPPATDGVCTCDDEMEANTEGLCVASHGELCTPFSDNCDKAKFLQCDQTTSLCTCSNPTETLWEDTSKTCKRRAFAFCQLGIGSQSCVVNSQCLMNLSLLRLECKCNDSPGSLVASTFGKCVHPYSYPNCFEGPYDLCNQEGHQRCQGGYCLCTDPIHMTPGNDGNCHLTMYSPCVPIGGVDCLDGMACIENQCRCDPAQGLVDNGKGGCDKSYGSSCDLNGDCNAEEFLECKNDKCVC